MFNNNDDGVIDMKTKCCTVCGEDLPIEAFALELNKATGRRYRRNQCMQCRRRKFDKDYRIDCFKHHPRECIVCGYDKIVQVHHVNEDHEDDRIENLVPLCANHHAEVHSVRHSAEVKEVIAKYLASRLSNVA